MTLELSIPTTATATTPKPHTLYSIAIRQPLRSYTLQKRYTDFLTLHDALATQANLPPPAELPPKTWLKSTTTNAALAEDRRRSLEHYLCVINETEDPRWRNTGAWRTFLNLPAKSNKGTTAGRVGGPAATIIDPSVWLDVHRDVRSQLREARQAVARREAATGVQGQHEAAGEAKSALVRASAMFVALEGGLKSMSGGGAGDEEKKGRREDGDVVPTKLGEGEIRRRKDLLASATKEKEAVEEALSASVARTRYDGSDAGDAESSAKKSLLGGPNGGQPKKGRVLGAAKETEKTKELDNQGVLQLQQQTFREQDEDVGILTSTVQRLKAMGAQINDELTLQSAMLDTVDKDVERVGDKMNVAKKRINKIN